MKRIRKITALVLVFLMIVSIAPLDMLAATAQNMNTTQNVTIALPNDTHANDTRVVIFPGHVYAAPSQSVLFFAALLNQDDEMVGVKHDVAWIVRESTSMNTTIEEGYLTICQYEESELLYIVAASICGETAYDTTTVTLTDEALSMGGPFLRVQGEDAEILLDAVLDEFFSDEDLFGATLAPSFAAAVMPSFPIITNPNTLEVRNLSAIRCTDNDEHNGNPIYEIIVDIENTGGDEVQWSISFGFSNAEAQILTEQVMYDLNSHWPGNGPQHHPTLITTNLITISGSGGPGRMPGNTTTRFIIRIPLSEPPPDGEPLRFRCQPACNWGLWSDDFITLTEPTCTTLGVRARMRMCITQQCNLVDFGYHEPIYELGHDFNIPDWITTIEPTCVIHGEKQRTIVCRRNDCDHEEDETDAILAEGHVWDGAYTVILYPTCTTPGIAHGVCLVCDDLPAVGVLLPLGHEMEITSEIMANCTSDGYIQRRCIRCNTEERGVIPAIGHNWNDWGATVYDNPEAVICLRHGTQTRTCGRGNCNIRETRIIDAPGHLPIGEPTITVPETCRLPGIATLLCAVCGGFDPAQVVLPPHPLWGDWSDFVPATCFEPMHRTRYCMRLNCDCINATQRDEFPPKRPHNLSGWQIISHANCLTSGSERRNCIYANCDHYETRIISSIECNNFTVSVATCFVARVCIECGIVHEPQLDHDFSYFVWYNPAPTYTESGYRIYRCRHVGCTETHAVYIPPLLPLGNQITTVAINITAPTVGAAPNITANGTGNFTISGLTWSPTHNPFQPSTMYTASVTLTANAGFTFASNVSATINEQTATIVEPPGATLTITRSFTTGDKAVTGISIQAQPSILVYEVGQAFNHEGLAVRINYDDSTYRDVVFANFATENITISVSPPSGTALEEHHGTPVTVTLGEFTATTNNLMIRMLTPLTPITEAIIDVTTPTIGAIPNTTAIGAGNFTMSNVIWTPDHTSFQALTTYTASVTLTANDGFTFAGITNATINGQAAAIVGIPDTTLTITRMFPTTSEKVVTDITIQAQPSSLVYEAGQTLSLAGLIVRINYNDLTHRDIVFAGFAAEGITTSPTNGTVLTIETHHDNPVTVTLGEFTATTNNLTVVPTPITSAAINVTVPVTGATPNTTAIGTGNFNVSNVTWTPSHNPFHGSTEYTASITLTANAGFTFAGITNVTINEQAANVMGIPDTMLTITRVFPTTSEKVVTDITIQAQPSSLVYEAGQTLSLAGLIVRINYDDLTYRDVVFAGFAAEGITTNPTNGTELTFATHHDTPITVTFGDFLESTNNLTVTPPTISNPIITSAAINVTAPVIGAIPNTIAIGTGNFTMSSVTWTPNNNPFQALTAYTASLTLTANDGFTFATDITNVTINGQTANIVGTPGATLTITREFPTTSTRAVGRIEIQAQPSNLVYQEGQTLNLAGLIVRIIYDDSTHRDVAFADFATEGITTSLASGTVLSTAMHHGIPVMVTFGGFVAMTNNLTVTTVLSPTPITTAAINVTAPVIGATPDTTAIGTGDFTIGNVTWTPNHSPFQAATTYTSSITLTANEGFTFAGITSVTINGQAATVVGIPDTTMTITRVFTTSSNPPTGISIQAQPSNLVYVTGQTLNLSGLIVRITYDDSTHRDIAFAGFAAAGITTSPTNDTILSIAMHHGNPVTVTFGNFTATTNNLTVTTSTQTSIHITRAAINVTTPITGAVPNTTATGVGDFTIGNVTWTPAHNPFQALTTYTASVTLTANAGFTFAGITNVTINGQAANVVGIPDTTLTITRVFTTSLPQLTGISIQAQPLNMVYQAGQTLNLAGLIVRLAYNDSTHRDVTFAGFAAEGITTNLANGTILSIAMHHGNPVTVTFGNFTATTNNLTVTQAPHLTPITVAAVNVTAPVIGAVPNTTASGTGNFNIGSVTWSPNHNPFQAGTTYIASVTLTANAGFTFAGITNATINEQAATVVGTPSTTLTITRQLSATVVTTPPTGLSIQAQPTTLAYQAGQPLNLAGLVVRITYNGLPHRDVAFANFAAEGITTTPANGTVLAVATHHGRPVTVSLDGRTATTNNLTVTQSSTALTPITTAEINVTAPTTGAVPNTTPTGTGNFTISNVTWSPVHNSFQASTTYNASVTLTANTGFTFVGITDVRINGQPATIVGTPGATMTIRRGFTTSARAVTGITIHAQPSRVTYQARQRLNLAGLIVRIAYDNSTHSDVAFSNFASNGIIANPANNTELSIGAHHGRPVTVSFAGFTATTNNLTVTPTPITSAGIDVITPVMGAIPNTAATASGTSNFTIGSVAWTPTHNPFQPEITYTASVTLTANEGFTFAGITNVRINGQVATIVGTPSTTLMITCGFTTSSSAIGLRITRNGSNIPNNALVLPRNTGAVSLEGQFNAPPLTNPILEWEIIHNDGSAADISSFSGSNINLTINDSVGSAEIIVRARCSVLRPDGEVVDESRITLLVYTPVESVTIKRDESGSLTIDRSGFLNIPDRCRVYIEEVYPQCDFSDRHPNLRIITWQRNNNSVNVNNVGEITAENPGEAQVWANVTHGVNGNEESNRINITVEGAPFIFDIKIGNMDTHLREGDVRNLVLDFNGPARSHAQQRGTRSWHSSDTDVVTVSANGQIRVVGDTGQTAQIHARVSLAQPGNTGWYILSDPITINVIDPAPTIRITSTQDAFDEADDVIVEWVTTPEDANPALSVNVTVTREVVQRVSTRILFFTFWRDIETWEPYLVSSSHQGNSISFPGTLVPGSSETLYRIEVEVVNDRGDRSATSKDVRVIDTGSWLNDSPLEISYVDHVQNRTSSSIVSAWQSGNLTMVRDLSNRLLSRFHWRAEDTLTWRIVSQDATNPIAQIQHWTSEGWVPLSPNQQISHNARVRIMGFRNGTVELEVSLARFAGLEGGRQIISVTVQTLPGSLHLIQTEPELRNGSYAIFTDINGIVHARPISGSLHAIYHEEGVHGYIDIVGISNAPVSSGIPYFGAEHAGRLNSATHNRESPYTFNLIPLRRATQQRFIINTPDGQPFAGNVQVSGGALLNREFQTEFEFDSVTFVNGVLEITMNSGAFSAIIDGVADAILGPDPPREQLVEFVYELRFDGTPYAPQLIYSRGIVSGRSHFNFSDTVVTLREWDREGFIDVRYLYDSQRYPENEGPVSERWEDVTNVTSYIGPTTAWRNATLTTVLATRRGTVLSDLHYVRTSGTVFCNVQNARIGCNELEPVAEEYMNNPEIFDWSFLSSSPYNYYGLEMLVEETYTPQDPPILTIGIPQAEGWYYAVYGDYGNYTQRIDMPMGVFNRIGMDVRWEDIDFTIDLSGAVTNTSDAGGAMGGGGNPSDPDTPIRPLPSRPLIVNLRGGSGGPTFPTSIPHTIWTIPITPIPTLANNTFGGWSLTVGGTAITQVPAGTTSVTLHALWTPVPVQGASGIIANGDDMLFGALSSSSTNPLVTRMLDRLMPAGNMDVLGFEVRYGPQPDNPLVYDIEGSWKREWARSASASRTFQRSPSQEIPDSPNIVWWNTGPRTYRLHNHPECYPLRVIATGTTLTGSFDQGRAWFEQQNRSFVDTTDLECQWNGGCLQRWPDWHNRVAQYNANLRTQHANSQADAPRVQGTLSATANASASAYAYFRGEIGWCLHERRFVREIHELVLELTAAAGAGVSATMTIPPINIPIPGLPVPPSVLGLRFTFNAGISMDIEAKVRLDNNNIANLRDMDWLSVTVRGNAYLSVGLAAHLDIWIAAASVGVSARIDFDAGFATYPLTWIVDPHRFDYVAGMMLHGTVGIDYNVRVGPKIRIFGRRLYRTWNGWIWRTSFPIWPRSGPANWCACGLGMNNLCNNERCWDLYTNVLLPAPVRPTRPGEPARPLPTAPPNNLPSSAQAAGSSVLSSPPQPNLSALEGRQQPTDTPVSQGSSNFAAMAWVSGICEEDIREGDELTADEFVELASRTEITVTIMQNGVWGESMTLDTTPGVASINPRVAVCEASNRVIVLWEEMVFSVGEPEAIPVHGDNGEIIDYAPGFETFTIEQRNIRFSQFDMGEFGGDGWSQTHRLDIASGRGEFGEIDIAINQWGTVVALSAFDNIRDDVSNVYVYHINRDGTNTREVYKTTGSNMTGHPSVENYSDGFVLAYFTDNFGIGGDVVVRVLDPEGNRIPGLVNSLAAASEIHGTLPTSDYRLLVRNHPTNQEMIDEIVIVWVAFCMTERRSVIHAALLASILEGEYMDLVFTSPITINTRVGAGDDAVLSILNASIFNDTDGALAVRVLYNLITQEELAEHEDNLRRYNRLVNELADAADDELINSLLENLDDVLRELDNPGSEATTIGHFYNRILYHVSVPDTDVVPGSWLTVELAVQNAGTSPMTLDVSLNGRTSCFVTDASFSPSTPILPNEIYSWVVQVRVEANQDRLNYEFIPYFDSGVSRNPPPGYIRFALPDVSLGTVAVTRSEDGQRDITIGYFSINENVFPTGAMVYTYVYRDPLFVNRHRELTAELAPFPASWILGGGYSVTVSYDVTRYIDQRETRLINTAPLSARPRMLEIRNERRGEELPHAGITLFIRTEIRDGNGQLLAESDFSRNTAQVTLESLLRNNQPAVTATVSRFRGQTADVLVTNRSMQPAVNVRFYARLLNDDSDVIEEVPIDVPLLGRESAESIPVSFISDEGVRVIITMEPLGSDGATISVIVNSFNRLNATTVFLLSSEAADYADPISGALPLLIHPSWNDNVMEHIIGMPQVYNANPNGPVGAQNRILTFENVDDGEYILVITKPGHLRLTIHGIEINDGEVTAWPTGNGLESVSDGVFTVTLMPGDIDGDDFINAIDFALLTGAWGSTHEDHLRLADLDGGGNVDPIDFAFVTGNWGRRATVLGW
jgi:hypothetical protein